MARLLRWVVPVVGLGALQLVAVTSVTSPSESKASDRWYPREVGTTWVYASRSNGQDRGSHVVQVVAQGSTLDGPAAVIDSRWDDLLGLGPVRQVQYLGERDGQLLLHGVRANGSYTGYEPPQPQWREALAPGGTFSWSGTYGVEQQHVTTTLEGVEDMVAAGARQPGCHHFRSTIVVSKEAGDVERSYEAWLCPGIGPVRTAERAPDLGAVLEEDLVAFRSPDRQLGAVVEDPPAPTASQPGETAGVDNERTGAVLGGSVDLSRLAWSDGRKEQVKFPPVGRDDLVVLAEQDGTVSTTRPSTGEVVWRVVVPGPVPVSPVLAGPYVVVAGADKVLSALDVDTGLPHWTARLPDVPAVAPMATADTLVVAGQDRRVRALRLADGGERWATPTGDIPGAPPALAGGLVVVGDKAGGMAALRLSDGGVQWSATLERRLTSGPATGRDRVIVVDKAGIVSAFDSASGDLHWSRYVELDIELPVVVAGDTVVLAPNSDRLLALDRRTGDRRWLAELGARSDTQPLVVGDSVLVTTRDNVIEHRSLTDGSLTESVPLTPPTPASDIQGHLPPVWVDGRVIATFDLELPWPRTALLAFGGDDAGGGIRLTGELRSVPGLLSGLPRFSGSDLVVTGTDNTASVVSPSGDVRRLVTSDAAVTYAIPAGDLVLTTQGDQLVAVPLGGGEPRWTLPAGAGSQGREPAVAGDTVVAPVAGVGLLAASVSTGTPKWVHQAAGEGTGSPVILPDGDVLYGVGGLVRLDGQTGRPRWSVPGVTVYGPLAVGSGVVVLAAVADQGSNLLAVDLPTGRELWRLPFRPALLVGPASGAGTVVAADAGGQVVGLDAATGSPLWSHTMRSSPGGTPVVLGDRVVVFEGGREEDSVSRDTRVSVHDLRTGRFLGGMEPPGFALVRGTFGPAGSSIVTYTIASGAAVLVVKPE
ncbi:MAG TPA: PQQ-binding-like beta-propeller repeat protein [Acidimicrobiales bacterium]|nr:PQQ-binding-like beta-propeller repeat protein [Acidimicrobiales bacterium]